MTYQKLLPCPFCGSVAEVKSSMMGGEEYSNVSCTKIVCPANNHLSHHQAAEVSVRIWNTRHVVTGKLNAAATKETDSHDPLYMDAVAFVHEAQNASISGIQRKLRIGFNRAARFIELMEAEGIVSKPKHDGSRLVTGSDGVAIHD